MSIESKELTQQNRKIITQKYITLVKDPSYGPCNVQKRTIVDMIFYYFINFIN